MKLFQLYNTGGYARWVLPVLQDGHNILYFYGLKPDDNYYKKVSVEAETIYDFDEEFKKSEILPLTELKDEEMRNILIFWFEKQNNIVDYMRS